MELELDFSDALAKLREPVKQPPISTPRVQKHRQLQKNKVFTGKDAAIDSSAELTKKNALDILAQRGINNGHVAETVAELLQVAARHHKLVFNEYLVRQGLRATLAVQNNQAPPIPPQGTVPGELSTKAELWRIWDASLFREPDVSFEQFLETRALKADGYRFGKELLQKDFAESCHKSWFRFWPRFNPTTLPPNYSQQNMQEWLDQQSEVKDFLLLASRDSRKTTTSIVWVLCAILICPDLRILAVSEVHGRAKGYIRALRGYFEVLNPNSPTRFQQYFPEFCINENEGSGLEFRCPMAHLGLIECVESTSMDSSVAGRRSDLIIGDDICSNQTMGNDETRQSGFEKWILLGKLKDAGGITIMNGTPYHQNDVYGRLIAASKEDPESLALRVDPCWTLKPEAQARKDESDRAHRTRGNPGYCDIRQIKEDEVILLAPEFLTFKFLMRELKKDERLFRTQNLCEFVPEEAEETLSLPDDLLRAAVLKPSEHLPLGETVIFADTAFSTSARADLSAITAITLARNSGGYWTLYVLDQVAGRFRGDQIALEILKMAKKYTPTQIFAEKPFSVDLLDAEIRKTSALYGLPLNIFWCPPDNAHRAKFARIKATGMLLPDRLRFVQGEYIEELFAEARRISGTALGNKKDDRWDSISLASRRWMGLLSLGKVEDKDIEKIQAEQNQAWWNGYVYNTIFERQTPLQPPQPIDEPVPAAQHYGFARITPGRQWGNVQQRRAA